LLASSLANLVNTRLNPRKQYPALIYSRDTMLPINSEFISMINLALAEIRDSKPFDLETHTALVKIRHLWSQNISNFRMYLANRLGSFDEKMLATQERDIYITLDGIQKLLHDLEAKAHDSDLGFQTTISIEQAEKLLNDWQQDFKKVAKIHATDKWRADANLLRHNINPLFDQLWNRMRTLDIAIESSSDVDIASLTEASRLQNKLLWSLFAMGLLFILAVYVMLDRIVLRPVKDVVSALQAEAHGNQETILPTPNSQETLQLIDAFREMRKQIHNRQDALEYQALHDSLTGLANRHLLFDRLQQAIQHARRQSQSLAFYILDLDRFKEINDTLGHQVGDRLLEEVGHRLTNTLRDTDTVARLGGDEFAILIEDCDESKARHLADKILSAFEQTYTVDNLHLYLDVSIGISFYPAHDNNAQGLIQRADIAMYIAKRNKSGYAIYELSQDKHSINQLALGSDLREALENRQQLVLYYQPKQDLLSGQVDAVEALLRWQHPVHGFVPPAEIIPLAEHTGLIQSLTYWVIEEAIKQHLDWKQNGLELNIAINISAYNLQDKQFLQKTQSLLDQHQVDGKFLIFELTESAMMADPAHAIASITEFCKLGIQFAIDDFGTGFSSLSYLKQLPAHELKIDKSFVLNMTTNDNDAVIVRSIIELAHNLSLRVVAEGVENKDTLDLLRILDCDAVQGFYIQRPVAAEKISLWLSENTPTEDYSLNG
jgi:diguanylate cyclase (GGDEF)-like protein